MILTILFNCCIFFIGILIGGILISSIKEDGILYFDNDNNRFTLQITTDYNNLVTKGFAKFKVIGTDPIVLKGGTDDI